MLKSLFYHFLRNYLKFYGYIYFRDIKIYGKNNIPKKGGLLFSPNHQSAFIDPVLVASYNSGKILSLTRSDVFGGPLQWFLDAMEMLPIYRLRNGYSNLKKNEEIFEKCYEVLGKGKKMQMFSEGGLHTEYYLKRISKGSSRIAYNAQKKYPNQNIYIIPVGINYGHHEKPRCSVQLVFGKAIKIKEYMNANNLESENINFIRDSLQIEMENCLWLPKKDDDYDLKKSLIDKKTTKMSFSKIKTLLKENHKNQNNLKKSHFIKSIIIKVLTIPNIIPIIISRKIVTLIKDKDFIGSMKYGCGAIIFPIWWITSGLILVYFFSIKICLIYIICSAFSIIIRQNLLL